jgi:hypothetical protein
MKLYLVCNKDGKYLCLQYNHLVSWGLQEKASVYNTELEARSAGQFAFDFEDDANKKFDIITLETYHPEDVTRHIVTSSSDQRGLTTLLVFGPVKDRSTDDFILYCRRVGTDDVADSIVRGGYH